MNRSQIRERVLRNINQLASDESTAVSGQVTTTALNNWCDDVYREELFSTLADKFPRDFEQMIYPQATYTAHSTIASVSGTTLNASGSIFYNSMEGFEIHNADQDEKITISTYSSLTQVVMEESVSGWSIGDDIYVLGNVFSFGAGGDVTDLKEFVRLGIAYDSADVTAYPHGKDCILGDEQDLIRRGNENFSTNAPHAYLTTTKVVGTPTQAIGFLPYPTDYQGKWEGKYIQKPPALTDSTEPTLKVVGLSQVIVNGVTSKAFRAMRMFEEAMQYEEVDRRTGAVWPKGMGALIRSYKPTSRRNPNRVRPANHIKAMMRRDI